jgi:hypothetical protein
MTSVSPIRFCTAKIPEGVRLFSHDEKRTHEDIFIYEGDYFDVTEDGSMKLVFSPYTEIKRL